MSASEEQKGTMAVGTENDEEFTVEKGVPWPAHFLFKIESFSLPSKDGIRKYESRKFRAEYHIWRLIIYPDGHEKHTNGDHLSVFLSVAETSYLGAGWEVNAISNNFLYDQVSDDYHCFRGKMHRFNAMSPEWGFPKLISKTRLTDPLNGYLVDDKCIIGAEVFRVEIMPAIDYLSLKANSTHKHQFVISEFYNLKILWTATAFHAGDYNWIIKVLHPYQDSGAEGRSITVMLRVDLPRFEEVRASYRICLQNHLNSIFKRVDHHWFTSSSCEWSKIEFGPIADVRDPGKGSAVKDCCIVEVEITVDAVSCYEDERRSRLMQFHAQCLAISTYNSEEHVL